MQNDIDPRIGPVAKFLCEQCGDTWGVGKAHWVNVAFKALAAADAAAPSPWCFDMESAPKDKPVLVWWPIVATDDDGELTDEEIGGEVLVSEKQSNSYWLEPDILDSIGDHMGDDCAYAEFPRCWQPRPAPPLPQKEGE